MNKRTIQYRGADYPAREVRVGGWGHVIVSVMSLHDKLVDANGCPVSYDAEYVDDGIFFFVEDCQIDLPDEEIEKIVLENL